jgi:hypothetical protein
MTIIRHPTGATAVYREHVHTASYTVRTVGQNGCSVEPVTILLTAFDSRIVTVFHKNANILAEGRGECGGGEVQFKRTMVTLIAPPCTVCERLHFAHKAY